MKVRPRGKANLPGHSTMSLFHYHTDVYHSLHKVYCFMCLYNVKLHYKVTIMYKSRYLSEYTLVLGQFLRTMHLMCRHHLANLLCMPLGG